MDWKTASASNLNGSCVQAATNLDWRKARSSAANGGCVTVAVTGGLSFATDTTEDDRS